MAEQIFELRGVDEFYIAKVLEDTSERYRCSTPHQLAIQQVGRSVSKSSETHFYNNVGAIIVDGGDSETINFIIAPPMLETFATMIGRSFDPNKGMMIEIPPENQYFAVMYRTQATDNGQRYVVKLKGKFGEPEETIQTKDDGTTTTNYTIAFTVVYTAHKFEHAKYNADTAAYEADVCKGIVVDTRYNSANIEGFFEQVQTPDTIASTGTVSVIGVGVTPSTLTLNVDDTYTLTATVTPYNATNRNVAWSSSAESVATVDSEGTVTAVTSGSATITATTADGSLTDSCSVTVS